MHTRQRAVYRPAAKAGLLRRTGQFAKSAPFDFAKLARADLHKASDRLRKTREGHTGNWTAFTEEFLADRKGRGDVPGSLDVYRRILTAFARWYGETTGHTPVAEGVTGIDGAEYRAWLASRRKPSTVNIHVRVLRMAFRWAVVPPPDAEAPMVTVLTPA